MKSRNLSDLAPAQLDRLLGEALECAIAQRRIDVAECIVCAIEAHAAATGDDAALDAAYLRAVDHTGLAVAGLTAVAERRPTYPLPGTGRRPKSAN